jgi:hypothetical protein
MTQTLNTSKSKGSGQTSPANGQAVELLTRQQLAERWQVCPHTIARNKALNPIRLNRRLLRYRLTDVVALEK